MLNKIFVIGLNKQATRSIHALFKDNGYLAIHWRPENEIRKVPGPDEIIKNNIEKKKKPTLDRYEKYKVFSDIHYLSINFEIFDQEYPNSIFIFNYRDINKWICSRLNHCRNRWGYVEYWKKEHQVSHYTVDQVIEAWRKEYNSHYNKVVNYFKDKPEKLIMFNIDIENMEDLAAKLPFTINTIKPHQIGKTDYKNKWVYKEGKFKWNI